MYSLAQDYLAARRELGNSNTEAIRVLKRHLARRVFTLLRITGSVAVSPENDVIGLRAA